MAPAKKKSAKLPHGPPCGMIVQARDEDFPFCSDRCRRIDLGKWAMGVYKISSPVLDPGLLEDLEGPQRGSDHVREDSLGRRARACALQSRPGDVDERRLA